MRPDFRRAAAVLVLVAAVAALPAKGDDLPSGYGVVAASGSSFTTDISPGGDTDDYAFPVLPGAVVTVMVKPAKAATPLVPELQFIRPDGTIADDDSGVVFTRKGTEAKGQSITGTMTIDTPGWWQARVGGKNFAAPTIPPDPPNTPDYSTGTYTVTIKYTFSPTRPPLPSLAKPFTKTGEISTTYDTDDYRFQAFPGQTIALTVKRPSRGTLVPGLRLFRPDGSDVAGGKPFDGKQASIGATVGAAEQGTWTARVFGVDPSTPPDPKKPKNTTGVYTLSMKLGKPAATPSLAPDDNKQYRFIIPAAGGVTLGYTLSFKLAKPTDAKPKFNSLTDPLGKVVSGVDVDNSALKVAGFQIPASRPIGNYVLTFDAPTPPPTNVSFASRVTAPTIGVGKARKSALAPVEPIILINGVTPTTGGVSTVTTLTINTNGNLVDPAVDDPSKVAAFIDHVPLEVIGVVGSVLQAKTPVNGLGLPLGLHDVVVQTSSGQVAVAPAAFELVPPPSADSIDPTVGSIAGGYPMVIYGSGFSKLTDPEIVIDSLTTIVPVHIDSVSDTEIHFIAPAYGAPGKKTFGVVDARNGNGDLLPLQSFEFVSSPAISRLVPNLTTILGGDLISITGANFNASDHVYLETTAGSGTYDDITASTTLLNSGLRTFTSPAKGRGVYNVYVTDQFGQPLPPRVRPLTYFQFSDLSATTQNMFPSGADVWDGTSVAVADFDKDGIDDVFISRVGNGASADASSDTRVLKNDGTGRFTDVTQDVMPSTTTSEDFRADRIWVTDVNQDGYPDIVITTNDSTVLNSSVSHTRILINEPLNGSANPPRVFRNRTSTLMPAVRMSNPLYSGSGGVADNWRGLDMWVGDVDKGPAAPPEILITHKELKQELDVSCTPYCSSPTSGGYTYGFYWGGSRAFFWDKNANGGLGKYKFERNFFPRKSGLRVPVTTPSGVVIPICNSSYGPDKGCLGKFTPFLGKKITAGDLDGDGKPDVAVVSDGTVQRIFPPSTTMTTISSLQVGINRFNATDGAEITDVTSFVTALLGDFRSDAIAIAPVGYPDGNGFGTIAVAKAVPGGAGNALRLVKFKPGGAPAAPYDFEDITSAALPAPVGADVWQASTIFFKDIDNDGDQDLILVAPSSPDGTAPAFRILRNDIVNLKAGIFTTKLMPLVQNPYLPLGGNEHYEGDAAAMGDINHDGTVDFVVVRASTTAQSPETRVIIIDKRNN